MTAVNAILFNEEDDPTDLDYLKDTARSIEIVREITKDGRLGCFGFTLVHQRPLLYQVCLYIKSNSPDLKYG